jgi:hypothetical protein
VLEKRKYRKLVLPLKISRIEQEYWKKISEILINLKSINSDDIQKMEIDLYPSCEDNDRILYITIIMISTLLKKLLLMEAEYQAESIEQH